MPFASNLAGFVLAVLLSAGGFSYTFSNEAKPNGEAFVEVSAKGGDLPPMDVIIKGDGQTIKKSVPALKNGQKHRIDWIQQTPRATYKMELTGPRINGSTSFEIVKSTGKKSTGPGRIINKTTPEDIENRKVKFQVAFDVASYELSIYDTNGNVAHSEVGGAAKYANGDVMEFTWEGVPNLFMIEIKAVGEQNQTGSYRLVPWKVSIPHVDVIFDSGKAVIKPGEAPKVDEAFDAAVKELVALERINQAVNADIKAQLYIIGYTDTVGNAGKNQKLSRGRAKAIANYFKKKGIWCEIYYAGMGENGLAVQTEDNVDEARNRRAAYVLAPQKPPAGGKFPSNWTKLSGARKRPANIKVPATATLSSPALPETPSGSGGSGGSSGDGGDSGGSGSEMSGGTSDEETEESYENWEDALGDEETPPEIEDEPGASKKGCAVDPGAGAGTGAGGLGLALLVGLVGLRRRRRR